MFFEIAEVLNQKLFYPFGIIFAISVYLTIKSGFVQLRSISQMWKFLSSPDDSKVIKNQEVSVSPRAALLLSMSTSIGLGNILGPVVAISMAGPWALFGFIIAAIFGSVLTFCEVVLAIKFRSYGISHLVTGPMVYIRPIIGKFAAKIYAIFGLMLLTAWSTSQAGSLAEVASFFSIPKLFSACFITSLVLLTLIGGVELVAKISGKIVPWMLALYLFATGVIITLNIYRIPELFVAIFAVPSFNALGVGFMVQQAVRWGFAKGVTATESGVGTATFSHGASNINSPYIQGVISIFGVFVTTFICLLSGLSFLLSFQWSGLEHKLDIYVFLKMFSQYFPFVGPAMFFAAVFLFAFGTILGNCFNASQCFKYLFGHERIWIYYLIYGVAIFVGSQADIQFLWSAVDFFVVPVAFINILAIMVAVGKNKINWYRES